MGGVVEGLERELGAKVSGHRISLLIISSIKCPLFRRKTPRIFQHGKNSGESAPSGNGMLGAQNESSVENGKAFCEKAAREEAIISWSLFCAISPDTQSARRVGAECADGSFFFEQVVHHKLFRKRHFIKI